MIPIVAYADRQTRLRVILNRQASFSTEVDEVVRAILGQVRDRGDDALAAYTDQFDGVRPASLRVSASEREAAFRALDPDFLAILTEAARNIRHFHEAQRQQSWFREDGDGVILGQRVVPIERVGLYVPGGKAFYPSSLLMNAIPAQVAGVVDIHLVSPPGKNGRPHASVLATAHLLGLENVYAVGGAQAIAALAFGTRTIPRVDKIVGPGNAYVAAAKKQVYGPVAIDSIAGPSEIVVLADETADAEFVAADLLSQAEHDERASAILVTTSAPLARAVCDHLARLVPTLSRRRIVEASLAEYGACVVTDTLDQAVDMVNELAPEHLEVIVHDPWALLPRIRHAGAIFLGPYSTEPVGDYFAGPNHVLPTGGTARYASALGVDDFIRKQSVIAYTRERLLTAGPSIVRFANEEELTAHALAVQVRLDRHA
ncbi:MAG: histidinol dehydrogenase [Rhodothermales bacterium]|nr:histidinol dehydrogenase [Rhodothermales bacterium]